MLEYDIRTENEYEYPLNSISDIIPHLARFVSRLWQIHAFGEGNTRTTAVFSLSILDLWDLMSLMVFLRQIRGI